LGHSPDGVEEEATLFGPQPKLSAIETGIKDTLLPFSAQNAPFFFTFAQF